MQIETQFYKIIIFYWLEVGQSGHEALSTLDLGATECGPTSHLSRAGVTNPYL